MKIIDAHQHFWNLQENYLPWLADKPLTFRYGDYTALKRNYLPEDYRQDSEAFDLIGSVFIETEWDPTDPLGEVGWVNQLSVDEGLPSVVVAQAWLGRADVEDVLAAHGNSGIVRGIRNKPTAAASPKDVEIGTPGSMGDAFWRAGFALLAPNGLSFDLQTPWWHLREAASLAHDFPDTQIILNHAGLPADRSQNGLAGWRKAMAQLAEAPNVAVKISGLGQRGLPWSLEANRQIVLETIEMFGTQRCMFASNYPVDSLVGSFDTIFSAFLTITEGFSPSEREALFSGNAIKYYRIDPDNLQ